MVESYRMSKTGWSFEAPKMLCDINVSNSQLVGMWYMCGGSMSKSLH